MEPGKKAVKKFAKRFREIRLEKRWTQEQAAESLGLNTTYIGRLERGERNPSLATIARIAARLHLTISQLVEDI